MISIPPVEWLVVNLCHIVIVLVLVQVVMTWLLAFNVLNGHSRGVQAIFQSLNRLLMPLTRPLQRYMPRLGGVDITPMVLLLIVGFVRELAVWLF